MASFDWPPQAGTSGGVTSLNTLTGDIILAAGTGISLTPVGQTITIAATTTATVSSVGLALPSIFTVSGSPVTTTGTLTGTLNTQAANLVFAGPTTGVAATPTFRSLVSADISGLFGNLTDVGTDGIVITGGTSVVLGAGASIAQHVADATHNGYLSSTDWSTFNNKQATLTPGSISTSTTGVTVGSGASSTVGPNVTVNVQNATTSQPGLLIAADWNTFNNKQASGNYITALTSDVTASGPGSVAATIASGAVSLAKMANLAANSIIGNNTGSPATPIALTTAQVNTLLGTLSNPMTTGGDLIVGGSSGTPTRLANGTSLQYLQSQGGTTAAAWASFKLPTVQKFIATGTQTGWLFTISTSSTVAVGDTYTNNGNTYTVQGALSAQSGTVLFMSGTGATSGTTLTRASGAGTASITFSTTLATATYTTPTSPAPLYLKVKVIGGGGGGGGGSGSGSAGLTSYFGPNLFVSGGGGGGTTGTLATGGTGGTITVGAGMLELYSVVGSFGGAGANTPSTQGGNGGSSSIGGNGGGGAGNASGGSNALSPAANSGSGGGGGGSSGSTGSCGGGGSGATIEGIITSPTTSYPYVIGTGGSGGSSTGTGTTFVGSGTTGAAGRIAVEEHYQ